MNPPIAGILLIHSAALVAVSQPSTPTPSFAMAYVQVSPKSTNAFFRSTPVRGGRYELKNATMVDLVRTAYETEADKVVGGPSWLEMDRFDVFARVPAESTPDAMLRALLEDRFKLVVHKDTRPVPTYVLTIGKKPQLKEADGSEETGCKTQSSSAAPGEGGMRLNMGNANGTTTTLTLGPGMTVQFACRNMTMAAFAGGLRGMMGANLTSAVLDQTGLKGNWNFDVRWSMQIFGPMMQSPGDRISVSEALEKQLGLKLEEKPVPTPVIVVDSVNRKPTENAAGVAEALAPAPASTEFEVATVKPTDPSQRMGNFRMQPGGRLVAQGMPLRFLVARAFNVNNTDAIVGWPAWADTERFDINAKAPSTDASAPPLDSEAMAPLIRALLVDRFKMTYHTEDRPMSAYSLVAAKPKIKKADPASRTFCKYLNSPPGAPPGSRGLTCQNITMTEFAERLQNQARELSWPVIDATGIEGGWDFTLTFSPNFGMMPGPVRVGGGGGGSESGPPGAVLPAASDPTGGYTIFTAIEKQLGLKLEPQKRSLPVIVIDHIEQKPTEN
jgi:uncharacterized protein (TIGR03435 family)